MVQQWLLHKNVVKFLIFSLLFLSSLVVMKHNLEYNITHSHADEVHTINYGIESLYSGEVAVVRVGETTRWLARAIYPAALYYMNSNMGGEHYLTGWDYSSGNYLKAHFKSPKAVKSDPNVQDFVFAMKFGLGALVLLSFLLASYFIGNTYGFVAGITYFVFSLSTVLVTEMLSMFYTESSLIILFNITLALALVKSINSWRLYLFSALILAFAISTKLTGLLFVLPITALVVLKSNVLKGMKIEGFVLLTLLFLALINSYAPGYTEALNQMLANVYHLKTGHKVTQPSGMYQVKNILTTLGLWIYLFPMALVVLYIKKPRQSAFLWLTAAAAVIMLLALTGVHFFMPRNLTTPMVMMIFIIAVAFGSLIKQVKYKPQLVLLLAVFMVLTVHAVSLQKHYLSFNHESLSKFTEGSESIAVIGVEEPWVEGMDAIPNMPDSFTLLNEMAQFQEQFRPYDCIVVKRIKNNKHYTNYMLPMEYTLAARHGNYFVYKNAARVLRNKRYGDLKAAKLMSTSKFDIYQTNNALVYNKKNCAGDALKDRFSLHIYPQNIADLPEDRRKYKFDNLDFSVSPDSIVDGDFFATVHLPAYPIRFIRTGQFNKSKVLWTEELTVSK